MVQIIPAILSATEEDFQRDIDRYSSCESLQAGWIHIDFADNKFVPNKTVGLDTIEKFPTELKKEAHLMVEYPLVWVKKLNKLGFKRVIFHIEAKDDTLEVIEKIQKLGMEVGIAINPDTPIKKLAAFITKINLVLIMSIVPGFQGQPFIPESLDKIRKASQLISKNSSLAIGVDGHVTDENAKSIVAAGATQLTVGSFLLKGDIDENLEKIWEKIK